MFSGCEFASPVSSVTIDFAGGQYFTNETGRLDNLRFGIVPRPVLQLSMAN